LAISLPIKIKFCPWVSFEIAIRQEKQNRRLLYAKIELFFYKNEFVCAVCIMAGSSVARIVRHVSPITKRGDMNFNGKEFE
jgi:hypothetical protein